MKRPNFYKQYDWRWAGYSLNGANVARNGCGPSSIANIVSALVKSSVTPKTVFKWLAERGLIDPARGTYWQGITDALKHFGIKDFSVTTSTTEAKKCLNAGHWLIGVVGPSRWTSGGHYIVIYGLSGSHVLVSDSASASAYRQNKGTFTEYASAEVNQWIDIDPAKYGTKKSKGTRTYTLYVADEYANVRKGRGTKYGIKARLKRGTKLTLYSYGHGWYRIKGGKYKGYYIHQNTLSKYAPVVARYKALCAMNIRSGYSKRASILRTIPRGTIIRTTKQKGNWVYVPAYGGWTCLHDQNGGYYEKM